METKMYSMPVEKNEMKNYLIANFDKEEMRKIIDIIVTITVCIFFHLI